MKTSLLICAIIFILSSSVFNSAFGQVNLNSGLIAYYPFNGNTNDASGNGNNAINFGAIPTTGESGLPNTAYQFDGINDYMRVANNTSLQPSSLTIYAKIYPTGFNSMVCYGNVVIGKGDGDFFPGCWSLRFSPTDEWGCVSTNTSAESFYTMSSSACSYDVVDFPPYIELNNWYCIIGIIDNNQVKMYVNGVLRYQCAIDPLSVNNHDVFIGHMNSNAWPYWFNGKMDEIRLYNRALTIDEIDTLCGYIPPPPVDTIINKYGAVLDYMPCTNSIIVDTASVFNVNDSILMIQMKGAIIDSTNTAAFGNIIDYQGAGNYEYNVIKAINGNSIQLKYPLARQYNIYGGKVQIVSVPDYQNYTINAIHTALPWTGNKGGVFCINVDNTLTLNEDINVTGDGFKGGQPLLSSLSGCNATGYSFLSGGNYGNKKGEGIATLGDDLLYGRGSLANGGGGGNDNNSGGGGGSNAALGGGGGYQFNNAFCTSNIIADIGGVGGKMLTYNTTSNKIFLGGGGGAGHGDNLNDKPGGNGGGIIIINAGNIAGNGNIIANGENAPECSDASIDCANDGGSGGGGGGVVLIKANSFTGNPSVDAKGGKGANVWVEENNDLMGPGGGGSGGIVWFSQSSVPSSVINNVSGGANGVLPQAANNAWGSQPGSNGLVLTALPNMIPTDTFQIEILPNFSYERIDCYTFQFLNTSSSNVDSVIWSFPDGTTSNLSNPYFTFDDYGTYPVKLTVFDSNSCKDSILIKNIMIPHNYFADAGENVSICDDGAATLYASGGISYQWSPVNGLSQPDNATTAASPSITTQYFVTVTDSLGCIDVDSVVLFISTPPDINITADGYKIICENYAVNLHATGAESYLWHPGIYCDDSTIANPLVHPPSTTTFTVVGVDTAGCVGTDTIQLLFHPGEDNIVMPNAFSPNEDGKNDKIGPIMLCGYSLQQFSIFNRWGQLVYATSMHDEWWDGFYNNKRADVGIYFYLVEAVDNKNQIISIKGEFTLLR